MPVRVLFLNTRNHCGADVTVHLSLMNNFTSEEAEVFVLSNSEASDAEEMRSRLDAMPHVASAFLPLGKPAEALAGKNIARKVLAYAPSAASIARAANFIRRNRIQIIHTTDRPRDASYAAILRHLTGVITVVHMHSHIGNYHTRPTLWGMSDATAIFAISDYIKNGLADMGFSPNKIYTVYNAVDTDYFDPKKEFESRQVIRSQFGIPETAPLVGIAARMNPWKGHLELIGATSLLRETHPDMHVLILGASVPEYRAEFEKKAREGGVADRIHFGGFRKDVRPFFQEIDLFVHPSYGEPFGLSTAEAMAMEKPVITCGTGGVPEIISHMKDGWLVEERSEEAVATAISALLRNRELGRQLGVRARETVRTRFSPRQQCSAVARRYTSLVATARGEAVRNIASSLGADGGPRVSS